MNNRTDIPRDVLNEAMEAWRKTAPADSLSESSRSALFLEVQAIGETSGSYLPRLTQAWRWAFLGSIPVVALAAMLMVAVDRHPATAQLAAAKIGNQVVFTLSNGRTDHVLYRSTDPHAFDRAAAVKMARNKYTESAAGGPALVFYRID